MTDSDVSPPPDLISGDRRRMRRRAGFALACLLLLAVAAVLGIVGFAETERERLVDEWDVRLGLVGDSRKAAVERWLNDRRAEVLRLAANRAVQFYLIDLADPELPREEIDGNRQYIEDLLRSEAERGGYLSPRDQVASGSAAGMSLGGIVILDNNRRVAARTPGAPDTEGLALDGLRPGQVLVMPPFVAGDGFGMLALVTAIGTPDGGGGEPAGFAVAFRPLDRGFSETLEQPGDTAGAAENFLIDRQDEAVRFLTPVGDGAATLSRQVSVSENDRAAVALLGRSGGSGIFTGYQGDEVLAVSRLVAGTDWTLVRQIPAATALSDGIRRIWLISGALFLALLLVAATVVAVWRKAVSDRLEETATELSHALKEAHRLGRLLRNVADAVPNGITAVDRDERVLFGNRAAFATIDISAEEAEGMALINLLGPGGSAPLHAANATVRKDGRTVRQIDDRGTGPDRSVVRRVHVPLDDDGVLIVAENMTEIVVEREARAAQLDALVNVLVDLIDARDRYAAHHSQRVARLSRQMAAAMDLPQSDRVAAETAARLMNLGKLRIDPAILTKTDGLTPDELAAIRDSILHSADLVQGIPFEGPVVETLRQMQERLDGSGRPNGVAGEKLLVPAQIVSLANAYVALISERAHRAAHTPEQALEQLWPEAEKTWRRSVMAALVQASALPEKA
ncbi:MAG: PAS domain-containing protein [Minwuia sp.]|nr:PAS domain-containing protein [Minwuia sp.]